MTIGKKIKRIREFRAITQRELGLALGYPEASASVRVAQYESNKRVPKKDTIIKISEILKCNFISIYDNEEDMGMAEYTMQQFFWLEESTGYSLILFPLEMYNNKDDESIVSGKYNFHTFDGGCPPVGFILNYTLVNDFMVEWATRYREYRSKEITWSEYFEWKINWPLTCDDGGKFEPTIKWRKDKK